MVFFGEGATSTGEFHVGMNFAGGLEGAVRLRLPQQRLGHLRAGEQQTAAKTFAAKASATACRACGSTATTCSRCGGRTRGERARAARGEGPTLIEASPTACEGHSSSDDPSVYRDPTEPVEPGRRRIPILRLRALPRPPGPVDEAADARLRDEIRRGASSARSREAEAFAPSRRSRRCSTTSTRSCSWHQREQLAELEQAIAEDPRVANPRHATPDQEADMPTMNIIQAVNDALQLEMRRDQRVVVLGEDVGKFGGVFRATQGLYDEFGADRVIDTPLAEGGIIGTAIGMALYGLRPVPEIQFADFIFPAFDQIVNELAKFRYRSGGAVPCPLVIRTPVRRRHPRRPLPLAVARGALHPHAGPQGRRARRTRTTPRACLLSAHPRSGPGALLGAEAHLPRRARATCPEGDYTDAARQGARSSREGDAGHAHRLGRHVYEADRGRARGGRRGVSTARCSTSARCWPLDIDDHRRRR